jgi:hypothetical protein
LPPPPSGLIVTITGITEENVAQENSPEELKWCVCFSENSKPFVLNQTNMALIGMVTGSDETDNWKGKKVEVYFDPSIMMKGKVTGGMRIRPPNNTQTADQAINNAFNDDIPL